MGPLWGIDLGGTKIEGVILEEREHPRVLKRLRIPTESTGGYQHIIEQIVRLVEVLTIEAGIMPEKLGIGSPGTLDPGTQLLKNSNTVCMNGKPFKRDLEIALGVPIELANDANCFAMAEAHMGAAADMPDVNTVFGVIMGTGVGGGIVVNGEVIGGRQGIGGEWGHITLDKDGEECYCGKKGCVETIISGPALEKYYENLVGNRLPLKEIIERHHNGADEIATKTVMRLLKNFGIAMGQVINILDPDVIVLGGGLGKIDLLYSDGVWEVEKHVFNTNLGTTFVRPKLGDSAGVFGAALL